MKKENDPFGFNKAINWDKLEDSEILKELEKILEEEKEDENSYKHQAPSSPAGLSLNTIKIYK